MFPIATHFFLTRGVGVHRERLTAFEYALRDADIEQQNIVTISSILPPGCIEVDRDIGVPTLRPGEITFCVLARIETDEAGRRISASIGLARPVDQSMYGYISEHHGYGESAKAMGEYAEDLAAQMLATVLGAEFNPDEAWDERREQWKLSGLVVDTFNHTIVAEAPEGGQWVTCLAAAVSCG